MNMNKALQNLYHAVSNETTTKVNISKLLVDIHYAITGKESENKNNWSKIVNSMADNWPEGGGGGTTVEALSVTQNGTYTAPSGKAYSPVTVNVSGGSSDFSTATVTVEGVGLFDANAPTVTENGLSGLSSKMPLEPSFVVALYKGKAYLDPIEDWTPAFEIPAGETNIYYDNDEGRYVITGDCTITLS